MSFVTWCGSKSKILDFITPRILSEIVPEKENIYFEPFLGGGSVLISLLKSAKKFSKYICYDMNRQLILCFQCIKDQPFHLIYALKDLQYEYESAQDKKQFYYDRREEYNLMVDFEKHLWRLCALFIYLNKQAFRSLYRVSTIGMFNVPYGKVPKLDLIKEDLIYGLSDLFNQHDVEFKWFSYAWLSEDYDKYPDANKVIYMDPPYYGTFDDYTEERFNYDSFITFLIEKRLLKYDILLSNSLAFRPLLEELHLFDHFVEIGLHDRANAKHPENVRYEILAFNERRPRDP